MKLNEEIHISSSQFGEMVHSNSHTPYFLFSVSENIKAKDISKKCNKKTSMILLLLLMFVLLVFVKGIINRVFQDIPIIHFCLVRHGKT